MHAGMQRSKTETMSFPCPLQVHSLQGWGWTAWNLQGLGRRGPGHRSPCHSPSGKAGTSGSRLRGGWGSATPPASPAKLPRSFAVLKESAGSAQRPTVKVGMRDLAFRPIGAFGDDVMRYLRGYWQAACAWPRRRFFCRGGCWAAELDGE